MYNQYESKNSYLVNLQIFSYKLRGFISRESKFFTSIKCVCTSFKTNSHSLTFCFNNITLVSDAQLTFLLKH